MAQLGLLKVALLITVSLLEIILEEQWSFNASQNILIEVKAPS